MAYRSWATNDHPSTADLQNWEDQLVRCFSYSRPANAVRTDGMHIFEKDTGNYYRSIGSGAGATWRRLWIGEDVAWASWTPAVSQSGAVASTNNGSRWARNGRTVTAKCRIDFTAAGGGGVILASIPVPAPAPAGGTPADAIGTFVYNRATTTYTGTVILTSTTLIQFAWSGGAITCLGVSPAFNIASGDFLTFTVAYEAA